MKVCAAALKAFPQFNSSLDLAHKELVLKHYVHIGVAVDTPAGLLVPVLRDADRKGIEALAVELNDIAAKDERVLKDPAPVVAVSEPSGLTLQPVAASQSSLA